MPDENRMSIATEMEHNADLDQPPHVRTLASWRGRSGTAARWRARGAVTIALLFAASLGACGSASSTSPRAEAKQTCKQVEAVLSDGPAQEADPLGYAQAQILPLGQIHTTDAQLGGAIDGLVVAYRKFVSSDGSSSAKSTVSAASKTIGTLCPGIEL